jgi:hypothetical protein
LQYRTFTWLRFFLGIIAICFAVYTLWQFATYDPGSDSRSLFYPVAVVIWGLGPPAWFFAEYWMIDHKWILVPSGQEQIYLSSVKTYSDYASKIWAAVLAIVVFLYPKLGGT